MLVQAMPYPASAGAGTGASGITAVGTVLNSSDTSGDVPLPTYAAGDVVFIQVAMFSLTAPMTPSAPSGWDIVAQVIINTGRQQVVYARRMDGSEGSSVNINWGGTSVSDVQCTAMTVSGAVASGAFFEGAVTSNGAGPDASDVPMVSPAVTTTGPDRLVINFHEITAGSTNTLAESVDDWTDAYLNLAVAGNSLQSSASWLNAATAGVQETETRHASYTSGMSVNWTYVSVAVIIGGAGGGGSGGDAHRYWRVYNREGGSGGVLIAEVELRTSAGGADVTGSGTAMSSSNDGGNNAAAAFDNNTGTFWQSTFNGDTIDEWVGYDFGSGNDKDIVEIALTPSASYTDRMPREFDVQWSDDSEEWTTAWSVSFPTWTSAQQVLTKPGATPSRYWRLRADTIASGTILGLAEMELRETAGGADQTGTGTALAFAYQSGYPPSNAFDDDTSTLTTEGAGTLTPSSYIGYDFGSGVTKDIVEVSLTARDDGFYTQAPTAGWIESGDDGVNWVSRWTFSGLSWSSAGQTNVFSG